jgi:hypothetical protein
MKHDLPVTTSGRNDRMVRSQGIKTVAINPYSVVIKLYHKHYFKVELSLA